MAERFQQLKTLFSQGDMFNELIVSDYHFAKSQLSPMDLPKEKGEPPTSEKGGAAVIIDMDREGKMKILGQVVTPERLNELLKVDLANKKIKTSVIVRAERLCPSLYLNRLAGTLMAHGVRDWKLATSNDSSGSSPSPSGGGTP